MYGLLLATWLSGPPIFVPPEKVDEVAKQHLDAPDMDDFAALPQNVQNRIYELELEREMEIARIGYRLQMELRPENICIAAKGSSFPWRECLIEARYALSEDMCKLHEMKHDALDGVIKEKLYNIERSLK